MSGHKLYKDIEGKSQISRGVDYKQKYMVGSFTVTHFLILSCNKFVLSLLCSMTVARIYMI